MKNKKFAILPEHTSYINETDSAIFYLLYLAQHFSTFLHIFTESKQSHNSKTVKKVHGALLPFYGQFNRPTEAVIRAIVTKFRTKFTLLDIKPPTRLRRRVAISASVNSNSSPFAAIGPLLLKYVEDFLEGFRC